MPLYEYDCPRRSKTFERTQGNQGDMAPCPDYGKIAVRKVSTPAATVQGCSGPANSGYG